MKALLLVAVALVQQGTAQISVIGDLSDDRDAKPGEVYSGSVIIKNDTPEIQEAKVYQTDYSFSFDGSNAYGDPGSNKRSNAKWVKVGPSYISIPPLGTASLLYTVSVPRVPPELKGTYWSMVMIEGIARGSAESRIRTKDQKAQMGIQQTIRYGLQIATHIAGTGSRNIRFISAQLLTDTEGRRILQVDIENSGEIGVRPDVYAEVFDGKGVSQGKFPGQRNRIYPGTSVRQKIAFPGIGPGEYRVLVVVDAGGEDAFGAQYTLTF
jgi:hypothetical protein